MRSNPWVEKNPWRRKIATEKSMDMRSLAGYSPWGRKELDMTERLSRNSYNKHLQLHILSCQIQIK